MAVADVLTLLICPAMFMINDFYQNYQLGSIGCKMEGFLDVAFLITAVLNLSAVSYDRLTAIVLPTETRLTMWGVRFVIAFTWLGGFLIALPLALYRTYKVSKKSFNFWNSYSFDAEYIATTFEGTSVEELQRDVLQREYRYLTQILVCFNYGYGMAAVERYADLLFGDFLQGKLSHLLKILNYFYKLFTFHSQLDRYEKRVLNREHPLTVSYKKTVAKTLFIVVIVFIALRLPFTILVILRDQYITTNDSSIHVGFHIFWYISQYLMFLNAAVNPLIYGFNNDNFRRAYDQTPLCNCYKRNPNKIQSNVSVTLSN